MDRQTAKRLTALEDQLLHLKVQVDMANQREQALTEVLAWLLANAPDRSGASYLIDRLESLENKSEQLESVAAFEGLLELVGLWYDVHGKT